jgi:AAA+ ATPase superfamily predicted ATPase
MEFYNRKDEIHRLGKAIESTFSKLIIVYGRRRCGKSTLIKHVLNKSDIYYMAQQSDESVQLAQMANVIGERIPGFDDIIYPDWNSLLTNLDNTLKDRISLCIDEFPYLVKSSPDLPSIIQKFVDHKKDRKFHIILCGSSQQMMQGLVLPSSAPLYGRANEILKLLPLNIGWLQEAIDCTAVQTIEEFSIWGGVPRYWELRKEEASFESAIKNLILDRLGVLHDEPARLFLDDMRESVQAYSILSTVGKGANRLSEIAVRLRKPATHLGRPIDNLIKLGYLKREVPYGSSPKSNKKSVYRISDPFMNFYFSFGTDNLSRLELDMKDKVLKSISPSLVHYFAAEWERICRISIPLQPVLGIDFDICFRWWGTNTNQEKMEFDLVGESLDKKYLLVGECKWSKIKNPSSLLDKLKYKASLLPGIRRKTILPILFLKELDDKADQSKNIFTPADVLSRMK